MTSTDPPKSAPPRAVPRLALVFVLVPFAVSALALVFQEGSGFHAVSDNALNELQTRDVGRHAVLIGPYARDGWNHLGPALYYLLAVPYRLSGSNSIGLYLGALVINAASIAGIALIAKRHGGTSLMLLTLLGSSLVVRALGADFVRDPWNPYVTALPFALVVFLVWAMTCGDAWALPVAVAVASFCAQTHIEYVTLAIPLVLFGGAWLASRAYRQRRDPGSGGPSIRDVARAALISVGVTVVMWLPPVIDELTHSPGNFSKVFDYFGDPPPGLRHDLVDGFRVVGGQFALVPGWLTGRDPLDIVGQPMLLYKTPLPVLLLPFLAAIVVLRYVRNTNALRLAVTVALALALGVFSVARTLGPVADYRLRWSWMLAMIALVVAAWAGWLIVRPHLPHMGREWRAGCLVALAVVSVFSTVDAVRAGKPQRPESTVLAALEPSVVAALPHRGGDVVVQGTNFASLGIFSGLVLWLERRGIRTRVTSAVETGYGAHRVHRRGPVRAVLTVTADEAVDAFAGRPGQRLVAYRGDFGIAQRAPLAARLRSLDADYRAHKVDTVSYLEQLRRLQGELGPADAVFMQTPAP